MEYSMRILLTVIFLVLGAFVEGLVASPTDGWIIAASVSLDSSVTECAFHAQLHGFTVEQGGCRYELTSPTDSIVRRCHAASSLASVPASAASTRLATSRLLAFDVFDVHVLAQGPPICRSLELLRHALSDHLRPEPSVASPRDDVFIVRIVAVRSMRPMQLLSHVADDVVGKSNACPAGAVDIRKYFGLDDDDHPGARGRQGLGVRVGLLDTGLALNDRTSRYFRGTRIALCVDFTRTTGGRRGADEGDGTVVAEGECEDGNGHGTFVASIIAGVHDDHSLIGTAPNVSLYIIKVFSDDARSYTSWFARAFTLALQLDLDVINLSIGGMDYYDDVFNEKLSMLMEHGTVVVTANGNMGPAHGTTLSPADVAGVIGVGSIRRDGGLQMSAFTSRGMTTQELPLGIGRPKPDIVTIGEMLCGVDAAVGGLRTMSGTSVAAPIVTAAISLAIGEMIAVFSSDSSSEQRRRDISWPSPLYLLAKSADRLEMPSSPSKPSSSIFSAGMGQLNLRRLLDVAKHSAITAAETTFNLPPALHTVPSVLQFQNCDADSVINDRKPRKTDDWEACQSLWPLSANPVYMMPAPNIVEANITVFFTHQFQRPSQRLKQPRPVTDHGLLRASVQKIRGRMLSQPHSESHVVDAAWLRSTARVEIECHNSPSAGGPVAGFCHLRLSANEQTGAAKTSRPQVSNVLVDGEITFRIEDELREHTSVSDPVSLRFVVVPNPVPKHRRVLWDTQRSVAYPSAFIPSDDIRREGGGDNFLDSAGDDPYTNFLTLFTFLQVRLGLVVQRLGAQRLLNDKDFVSNFGTVVMADPEEDFFSEEVSLLVRLIRDDRTLNILVLSDWAHEGLRRRLSFLDDNLGRVWGPVCGGANVAALNRVLRPLGIDLAMEVAASGVWPGEDFGASKGERVLMLRSAGSARHIVLAAEGEPSQPDSSVHRWSCEAQLLSSDFSWISSRGPRSSPVADINATPMIFAHFVPVEQPQRRLAAAGRNPKIPIQVLSDDIHGAFDFQFSFGKVAVVTDSSLLDDAICTAFPHHHHLARHSGQSCSVDDKQTSLVVQAIFDFFSPLSLPPHKTLLSSWCKQVDESTIVETLLPSQVTSSAADGHSVWSDTESLLVPFAEKVCRNITAALAFTSSQARRRLPASRSCGAAGELRRPAEDRSTSPKPVDAASHHLLPAAAGFGAAPIIVTVLVLVILPAVVHIRRQQRRRRVAIRYRSCKLST